MSRADDDYDDRPRRRRRDDDYADDDYDDRPRRAKASGGGGAAGVAGLSIGVIIGIVVAVLLCCAVPVGIGLLLPAVTKVREAAARSKDQNNLKLIGLAFHGHADHKAHLPAADGDLSVRVHILPYMEQDALYRRFDLDQKWDGPKNRPLADTRVLPYTSALDDPSFTQTRMRVFTGPDTMFPPGKPLRLHEVKDGMSNTFLAAEATDPVPWPQPRELAYTKGGPLPALGHPQRPTGYNVLMGDGSVRFFRKDTAESTIRSGITANAGDTPPEF